MSFDVSDTIRRLHNVVRIGAVEEANYARALVRVRSGDLLTDWVPWLTTRAGADRSWWAPEVGEQVMLLSPAGELQEAVALPAVNTGTSVTINAADETTINSPKITLNGDVLTTGTSVVEQQIVAQNGISATLMGPKPQFASSPKRPLDSTNSGPPLV